MRTNQRTPPVCRSISAREPHQRPTRPPLLRSSARSPHVKPYWTVTGSRSGSVRLRSGGAIGAARSRGVHGASSIFVFFSCGLRVASRQFIADCGSAMPRSLFAFVKILSS